MREAGSSVRHPFESLIYLLLLALAGMIVFTVAGILLGGFIYGFQLIYSLQETLSGNDAKSLNFLKLIQGFSTVGTFIVPALVFARIESREPLSYLKWNPLPVVSVLLAIILMVSFLPFLEFTVLFNKSMKLPEFLKGAEEWMRIKESEAEVLTKKLLNMADWKDLSITLLIIAVLPAIGEEFFFRGSLQQTIQRWVKNYHVAIWITAIIFSSIHIQFYGFIPRMLLGAMLGYLFVWGKSIWLPVLVHFLNNGISVVMAYVYLRKGKSLDKMDDVASGNNTLYILSFMITLLILTNFYRSWRQGQLYKLANGERLA